MKRIITYSVFAAVMVSASGCSRKTVRAVDRSDCYTDVRVLRRVDTLSVGRSVNLVFKEPRLLAVRCAADDTALVELQAAELVVSVVAAASGCSELSDSVSVVYSGKTSESETRRSGGAIPSWLKVVIAFVAASAIGLSFRGIGSRR